MTRHKTKITPRFSLPHFFLWKERILIFGISFLMSMSVQSKIELSKKFAPYWAEAQIQYQGFQSTENFDSNGDVTPISAPNGNWSSNLVEADLRYVFNSNFALNGGYTHSFSKKTSGNTVLSSQGPQTLKANLEFALDAGLMRFVAEGGGSISLFRVNQTGTTPLIGDGAHTAGGRLWIVFPLKDLTIDGYGGYQWRSDGLSQIIPYHAGATFGWRSLEFGLSFDGKWSLIEDAETETYRKALLTSADAGSYEYRSANPILNELSLLAKFKGTDLFRLIGGVSAPLAGVNSSNGFRFFLAIDLNWQVYSSSPSSPYPWEDSPDPDKKNRSPNKKRH